MSINKLTRVVLAASALGVASVLGQVVVPPTFGGFTDSTNNPTNGVAAGTLQMTNTRSGAIFSVVNALPATVSTQTLTITNSGTLSATSIKLSLSGLTDVTCASNGSQGGVSCPSGVGTGALSSVATLSIVDGSTIVASGTLSTLASGGSPAGTYTLAGNAPGSRWAAAESHALTFTLTVPASAANTVQGTKATFDVNWSGVQ